MKKQRRQARRSIPSAPALAPVPPWLAKALRDHNLEQALSNPPPREAINAEAVRNRTASLPPRRFNILPTVAGIAVYSYDTGERVSPFRKSNAAALSDWDSVSSGVTIGR